MARTAALFDAGLTVVGVSTVQALDSTSASGMVTRQAATQDAVALLGRAGGSGSHVATITTATLSGNATITLPAATASLATLALAETLTNKTLTAPLITQAVATSGSPALITLTGSAHTTLAASTEVTDVNFNLARTVQLATGALATQRAIRVQAPTYAFVGASTITNAATLAISGAPVAGANATITNPLALWVQGGTSLLAGAVSMTAGTASADTATGTLVVTGGGGVGISGALNAGAASTITSTATTVTVPLALINNSTSGAFLSARLDLQAYDGAVVSTIGILGVTGSTWSYGAYQAIGAYLNAAKSGGLTLLASHASGSFTVTTGGELAGNIRMTISSAGAISLNGAVTLSSGSNLTMQAANFITDTTTGTKLGTATAQKLGLWNATPVIQPTAVVDATGGATVDTEARAAINALLARMRTVGMVAT